MIDDWLIVETFNTNGPPLDTKDIFNKDTGEVLFVANTEIDEVVLESLKENNVNEISCLFINELDKLVHIHG